MRKKIFAFGASIHPMGERYGLTREKIYLAFGNTLAILDAKTGQELTHVQLEDNIVNVDWETSDELQCILQDGSIGKVNVVSNQKPTYLQGDFCENIEEAYRWDMDYFIRNKDHLNEIIHYHSYPSSNYRESGDMAASICK